MTGNNIGQNREELRQPQHLNVQFRPPTNNLNIKKTLEFEVRHTRCVDRITIR